MLPKTHSSVNTKFITVLVVNEHEISYHTYTEKKSDLVEITASTSGLTACTARSGMLAGVPILGEQFNMVQQFISQAWKTIVNNDPEHVVIHPACSKTVE